MLMQQTAADSIATNPIAVCSDNSLGVTVSAQLGPLPTLLGWWQSLNIFTK